MQIPESVHEAFEGTKGAWIKFADGEEGKVVEGLVTHFHPTEDKVFGSDEAQPRLQIMEATGETSYVSMTTVLRKDLKELAPKIIPGKTIVRIVFKESQPAKNPAFNPTKIIKAFILNPDNANSDPAKKAAMDNAYKEILNANPIWDVEPF